MKFAAFIVAVCLAFVATTAKAATSDSVAVSVLRIGSGERPGCARGRVRTDRRTGILPRGRGARTAAANRR